jgi:hypothetical protein
MQGFHGLVLPTSDSWAMARFWGFHLLSKLQGLPPVSEIINPIMFWQTKDYDLVRLIPLTPIMSFLR